jgi:Domain of unknown function (DUF5916)
LFAVRAIGSFCNMRLPGFSRLFLLILVLPGLAHADSRPLGASTNLVIPRVSSPPTLEDFLAMKPDAKWEGKLARVEGFTQRLPSDGQPASQKTIVYLGYDADNLYCIYVAFDSDLAHIRAHQSARDGLYAEDKIDLFLDTYRDHRRAYVFTVNPYGDQLDGLWTEGPRNQFDRSWDGVWKSRGKVTSQGYVVWLSVPFRTLRFPKTDKQTWGIVFVRWIPRHNESACWPWVSTRIEGRISQEATLTGLEGISPEKRGVLIPYAYARSFRSLDRTNPANPEFQSKTMDPKVGADGRFVFKDSFSLDMTANPDFSQVESDLPQITVNRRFTVSYPEKRPFFLENSNYFETPMNLLFTRNIADPQFGVRFTGKQGPYSIGALAADDRSPGESVPPASPLYGDRAFFGVLRVNRDIFRQSSVGMIYTDRELAGTHNRVGGVDTRLKLGKNWWLTGQAVSSATTLPGGARSAGPAYNAQLRFDNTNLYSNAQFNDLSPGFNTLSGFIETEAVERPIYVGRKITQPPLRVDMRGVSEVAMYRFRPEHKYLVSWGPTVFVNPVWDHRGNRLDTYQDYTMSWEFTGQTAFEVYWQQDQEMLRPQDFQGLTQNTVYSHHRQGLYFETGLISQVSFNVDYSSGAQINIDPPAGQLPLLSNVNTASASLVLRPGKHLRIQNTYLLDRLTNRLTGSSVLNNHIIYSEWLYQFNQRLSLRVIPQYNTVLANPAFTSLRTTKNFNGDFLFTYLLNPFTALHVGYNGNMDNFRLMQSIGGNQIVRTPGLKRDGHQFFVKVSYLLRF